MSMMDEDCEEHPPFVVTENNAYNDTIVSTLILRLRQLSKWSQVKLESV